MSDGFQSVRIDFNYGQWSAPGKVSSPAREGSRIWSEGAELGPAGGWGLTWEGAGLVCRSSMPGRPECFMKAREFGAVRRFGGGIQCAVCEAQCFRDRISRDAPVSHSATISCSGPCAALTGRPLQGGMGSPQTWLDSGPLIVGEMVSVKASEGGSCPPRSFI